jgi:hypothetical protein
LFVQIKTKIMKQFFSFLIAFFIMSFLWAQKKPIQLQAYAESGYYFPSVKDYPGLREVHDGYGIGAGINLLAPVYKSWSVVTGLGYRYLHNGQTYTRGTGTEGSGYNYGDEAGAGGVSTVFTTSPKSYLLLPLKLRYTTGQRLFIETGAELSWLLNYKHTDHTTEFCWVVGAGMPVGKLEWSVQYAQALGKQSMGDADAAEAWEQEGFKNRTLSVRVACPIWQKKSK